MPTNIFGLILTCVIVVIVFSLLLFLIKRYKKCPSDKVMVIYGKVGSNKDGSTRSAKCIHGGAAFIWPVIQSYEFLDLTPMSISVDLENALSRQNIRINVPSRFTVGVSTEPGVMQNAAERLLGLKLQEIQELAKDIIFGQLRLVIATMDIEEINTDRDKFLEAVSRNVEGELKKIGLRLINVNVTDISDESGYIDALTAGQFVLFADDGVVKVEQDINSLVTYTTDITGPYHKNRVIRLLNTVANDIYQQFSDGYIGSVNNNEQGRMMFKSAIVGYLLDIQANNGIQNFEAEDVTVEPGEAIDAIVVNLAIQPVDSVEKIYVTITVN